MDTLKNVAIDCIRIQEAFSGSVIEHLRSDNLIRIVIKDSAFTKKQIIAEMVRLQKDIEKDG